MTFQDKKEWLIEELETLIESVKRPDSDDFGLMLDTLEDDFRRVINQADKLHSDIKLDGTTENL